MKKRRLRPADVYYIILDGYASARVLANDLGYDNSTSQLSNRKGSSLPREPQQLCIRTSPGVVHEYELYQRSRRSPDQQEECIRRIQESSVVRLFRTKGYKVMHFAPDWLVTSRNSYSESTFNRAWPMSLKTSS